MLPLIAALRQMRPVSLIMPRSVSMILLSTPNSRKSRARRLYSVTRVAMALVLQESSRFMRLLRVLSGLSTCRSRNPTTMTAIAAAGSTARATANSPIAIMSDWSPDEMLPTMLDVAEAFCTRRC